MIPTEVGSDRGATMVEYGIMVALVALVVVAAVEAFGESVLALFETLPVPF
ncbi:MAG: Flp family type IVb pilin [Dermatophilaceae bacterium]